MVFTYSNKIRFLALFVVAFICLNAGGALCVGYCQTFEVAAEEAEHCPLKKATHHCDTDKGSTDAIAIGSNEMDCCPMTVSFFGAPVEKQFRYSPVVATTVLETRPVRPTFVAVHSFAATFSYRGPPPLDRRVERIKHSLLRI